MDQGHLGTDPLVGVQGRHSLQEVNLQLIHFMSVLLHWDSSELWEGGLEIVELESIRPIILVRGSKDLEYFEDLVDFTVTHEQRSLLGHLGEDAASGPDVDSERVVLLRKQDLWASVPESHHFVGVTLDGKTERSCQSEIRELDCQAIIADEQVLRLQISVEDSVGVQIDQRVQDLEEEALSLSGRES